MKHSRVFALVAALLLAVSAHAVTDDVALAFDTDRKTSTGCTFTTPAGTFAGAEQLVVTHVSVVGGVATTTGVTRQACVGGSFAGAVPVDTHSWPAGLTSSGNLFIETHVNPTDISNSTVTPMRMAYFVTDGTHNDGVMANPAGGALLFPDASRRRVVGPGAPARTITLDGADADWSGISPVTGGGGGTADLRIMNGFAFIGASDLFFAVRLQANHNAPTAVGDSYTVATSGTLNVASPGVLANDSDPNSLPLTAVLVAAAQHGTLTLNANGSFDYTNDGSPAPLDTFEYKANNGTLNSNTAQVQIGVGSGGAPPPPPAPAFTSPDHVTFTAGTFGTFTVTTTPAHPTAAITFTGSFPSGVSFHDNGDGTATISGTPSFGGVSAVLLKATNVVGSATQNFTLTVSQPPAFTTPNATTFTAGSNGTFTVAASGFPPPALSLSGALPAGVTFGDTGNGPAQSPGTPAAGA